MLALIKHKKGPDGIELREVNIPVPRDNEVLVRVDSAESAERI